MAGKKKKTLANKLAKMSDEERARYLQHKAEIEEEARRRKEQLIASFMKKKIKKEDTFARLNMSKINQNWHQIMRKIKVNEMKLEVEQLKKWMEHTIEQKNLKIAKLMNELEEAEEQYLNNFYSHSTHLDTIIRNQHDNIEKLQIQYQEELNNLMFQAKIERNGIEKRAKNEESYLKTLIYGQGLSASKKIQNAKEAYDKILYEVQYNVSEKSINFPMLLFTNLQ
ncbi:hypothetical protein ABEB36_009770 [Hypothenemus hampei]|uniref:Dynein regulatory complex subunit 2 n=1 Tax=Hypothenemus hampei TaxID=57062 RepID=A0ABD1EHF6_HYPHA